MSELLRYPDIFKSRADAAKTSVWAANRRITKTAQKERKQGYGPSLKDDKSNDTPGSNGASKKSDEHYTPQYAVDILLPYLPKGKTIWEAAYGTGKLAKHLRTAGHKVVGNPGLDFRRDDPGEFDIIVANPPFSLKDEFLKRAYSLGKRFASLLPLEALTGEKRCPLFMRHGIEMLVPSKRIKFHHNGQPANHCNFPTAWFCWKLLPDKLIHVEATW